MERAKKRTVRLLDCCLVVPEDISSLLLDDTLAWLWLTSYDSVMGKYKVKPEQKMYDFGLDDRVPSDWLVWSEEYNLSISVIHDLQILHGLGVRGNFIINEVGTMTFEKWEITSHNISTYIRKVTFPKGGPEFASSSIPVTPPPNVLEDGDDDEND